MKPQDIKERTFQFAVPIVRPAEQLPTTRSGDIIAKQLVRAGTPVGANVEEATAAYSKNDFIFKMNIALREARESHFWLRLIQSVDFVKADLIVPILREAEEIMKILGAIVSSARGKRKNRAQP